MAVVQYIRKLVKGPDGELEPGPINIALQVNANLAVEEFGDDVWEDELTGQIHMDRLYTPDGAYKYEIAVTEMRARLERKGLYFRRELVDGALDRYLTRRRRNPIRMYLDSLKGTWDGTERKLKDYIGYHDHDYEEAVWERFLSAAVARIYRPGCKYDQMPILQGPQDIGKSSLLRILASPAWFADSVPWTEKDKVLFEHAKSKWIIESGELAGYSKRDINAVKAWITSQSYTDRRPYGKKEETFPRTFVYAGTTNQMEFLKDRSGARRFPIIECDGTKLNFAKLEEDRDQIWAEVIEKGLWQFDEKMDIPEELKEFTAQVAEEHTLTGYIDDICMQLFGDVESGYVLRSGFKMLMDQKLPPPMPSAQEISDAMYKHGAIKKTKHFKKSDGKNGRVETWCKGGDLRNELDLGTMEFVPDDQQAGARILRELADETNE